jgi:hypothetical protein
MRTSRAGGLFGDRQHQGLSCFMARQLDTQIVTPRSFLNIMSGETEETPT